MSDGGWIGLASILITGLLALANRIVSNRHSDELTRLKTENQAQAAKMTVLEDDQVRCKQESQECREEHAATKAVLESTRKELADRDARDKAELQKQIDDLKKQIALK